MFSPFEEVPVAVVDPELEEPQTDGDESMESIEDAEDMAPAVQQVVKTRKPATTRRQGVSRQFAEAVYRNPGLTQSEYQRALGIKSPIATMAKRLIDRGIIMAQNDGRFVRYFPGDTPYAEVSRGRKPGASPAASAKPKSRKTKVAVKQPASGFDSIDSFVTVEGPHGAKDKYVRIAGVWYELWATDGPTV